MDLRTHALVLVLAFGLVAALVGCGPVPTATPYPTNTPYPTYPPYPTYTPYPTMRPTPTAAPILAAPDVIAQGWEGLGLLEMAPMPDVPNGRFFSGYGVFGAIIVDAGDAVEVSIYDSELGLPPYGGLLENMMLATGMDAGVAHQVIDTVHEGQNAGLWLHPDSLTVFVEVGDNMEDVTIIVTGHAAWPTPVAVTPVVGVTPTVRPTVAPRTSFGDGAWLVGVDIAPGTYRTTVPGNGCMWQRLSGLSGTYEDIIAWGAPNSGQALVAIAPSDTAFSTDACGEWSLLP